MAQHVKYSEQSRHAARGGLSKWGRAATGAIGGAGDAFHRGKHRALGCYSLAYNRGRLIAVGIRSTVGEGRMIKRQQQAWMFDSPSLAVLRLT